MNISISYNWLRAHFDKDIPDPALLAELLTKNLAEVEGMEVRENNTIFDIKILPDRGHDLLCHAGIAREVSVLSGVPLKQQTKDNEQKTINAKSKIKVVVEDTKLCPRYRGLVVENVSVTESPEWLRARLESVGQRSINNIVDITNFVMLELGQPMHAFDAKRLSGAGIMVRAAKSGEKIKTLDDRDILLTPDTLVIADDKQVLAIAGVKGGKDAGVDSTTTSIVFEAANFNPVHTRKTSQRIGIRTDSSKRFEHGLSPLLTEEAMGLAVKLLLEMCPESRIGEVTDVYPDPQQEATIAITVSELNGILGTAFTAEEAEGIIKRLKFPYTKDENTFIVTPPLIRLDLVIKEDLAEEIGRVYGLDKIPDMPLSPNSFIPEPLKTYYYTNIVRDALASEGFSEVFTSSFQREGACAIENPLAEDKSFVRKDVAMGIRQALGLNVHNAPLLGLDEIKIFEIGKAFPGGIEEKLLCAIGIEIIKTDKKKEILTREALEKARTVLNELLGVSIDGKFSGNTFEFDLGAIFEKMSVPKVGVPFRSIDARYEKISAYPFMLRDIALWTPEGVAVDDVLSVISSEAGELLRTKRLFDVFMKEFPEGKKTSYAFNLVFQSYEKTLSDEEVNSIMERVNAAVSLRGWQVR